MAAFSRRIHTAFGNTGVSECSGQDWLPCFPTRDYGLEDARRSSHASGVDDDFLRELIEADLRQTTLDPADNLVVHLMTISNHLQQNG